MPVNKVVYNTAQGAVTLIDLTDSTVTPETLAEGVIAYNAKGERIVGTATLGGSGLNTFTIEGTSYQFEEGMTWASWIDADLVTTDCYLKETDYGSIVMLTDSVYLHLDDVVVLGTDTIENGANYTRTANNGEEKYFIYEFRDYDASKEYYYVLYFTNGMTWAEWIESVYNKFDFVITDDGVEGVIQDMRDDCQALHLQDSSESYVLPSDTIVSCGFYTLYSW